MSEAQDIIDALTQSGVVLWAEGSRLRYRAAKGVFTEELRRRLADHKEAVLAAWRQQAAQCVASSPATHGQRALWFLQQTMPQSATYNVLFSARIRSTIDVTAFRFACQALIDRHPALRTTFSNESAGLVQNVFGHMDVDLRLHDRTDAELTQLEEEVRTKSRVPFDLGRGSLLRIELFSRAVNDHVLLIAVHHIASDGWSAFLLLDDLRQLYPVERKGEAPAPPRPTSDVVAFARWQNEMLAGPEGRTHEDYWVKALAGEIPALAMPTDLRRPTTFSDAGSSVPIDLGPELSAAVHALAATYETTPYVVFLATYQVLLHRYTGQTTIIVGSPTYGRDRPEFANVVGDFINTIPLKADFGGDPTFTDFVAEMRRRVLSGIEHQDYPFPLLVERLQPHRDPSRTPVFQTLFILQKFTKLAGLEAMFSGKSVGVRIDFGGLAFESFLIPQPEGQVDLSLELVEIGGTFMGQLKYKTDLFAPDSIKALARNFITLLGASMKAPHTSVSRLPLIEPSERAELINRFNHTLLDHTYPREQTVVSLFAAQAIRRPSAVAVSFRGATLTYAQLEARANQLACHLQRVGVGSDTLVGLCVERSFEMMVGLLGIMKAGAAYVPLDPGFPAERLAYMLADSAAPVLVTQAPLISALFAGLSTRTVCLDTDGAIIAQQSTAAPSVQVKPENRAYVLYTSGSTGRPKGVVIEHRALTNFLCSMAKEPGMNERDVLVAVTTLSFDIAGLELFLPLVTGARIELVGRDTALDGVALGQTIASCGATIMQATPATWRALFESGWQGAPRLKALCGGEALSRDLAIRLLPAVDELWNMYGPTETTIWSSLARMSSADDITIGRPIANTSMYVLDVHREPVPRGVVGQLWIGGDGLAGGYLHRPELTSERFVRDPFNDGRMYQTGDLARYRSDGCLECLGRVDAQVKIRGYRIELGEIESVLGEHPDVSECAVVTRTLDDDTRLVAYIVGRASSEACREHLRLRLPEYMVPSVFVALSALPRTPNNKTDRNALPALDTADVLGKLAPTAPVTPTEKVVAEIFAEVLRATAVGVQSNFFELGGHSLLATRAVARLRERFAIEIPLSALFHAPTAQGFARWIDAAVERHSIPETTVPKLDQPSPWKCLVTARAEGSRPPLFLITGYMDADDTLRILSNLIQHLGADQPLCGLRPRWLDGHSPIYTSVAELTNEYLKELRAFQPQGPYYLLGDCVGGVVAIEMAQRLIALGEKVALLILVDTEKPRFHSVFLTEVARLWQRGKHVAEVLQQFIKPTQGTRGQVISDVFFRKLRRSRIGPTPITATDHIYEQRVAYQRLLKRHRLVRYPGRIILILTDDVYRYVKFLGWGGFAARGMEIYRTPGDHETFRAQYSKELGQRIRLCIDRAQLDCAQEIANTRVGLSNDAGKVETSGQNEYTASP